MQIGTDTNLDVQLSSKLVDKYHIVQCCSIETAAIAIKCAVRTSLTYDSYQDTISRAQQAHIHVRKEARKYDKHEAMLIANDRYKKYFIKLAWKLFLWSWAVTELQ